MKIADQIVELVKDREEEIINNINDESISVYKFLQDEFMKGDVSTNYLFQFVYRSFYRLDNAGLTDEFKKEYFRIMEEKRSEKIHDPCEIVMQLYHFKRRKGDNSIQFSFTTKMINTINVEYPIYDSEVAKVFKFSTYNISDIEKKIKRYIEQQRTITEVYKYILENKLLQSIFKRFDFRFKDNVLSDTKKLDFIIWSCGKLI